MRLLVDPNDPDDVAEVGALRDRLGLRAGASELLTIPDDDAGSLESVRGALKQLFRGITSSAGMFGTKVDLALRRPSTSATGPTTLPTGCRSATAGTTSSASTGCVVGAGSVVGGGGSVGGGGATTSAAALARLLPAAGSKASAPTIAVLINAPRKSASTSKVTMPETLAPATSGSRPQVIVGMSPSLTTTQAPARSVVMLVTWRPAGTGSTNEMFAASDGPALCRVTWVGDGLTGHHRIGQQRLDRRDVGLGDDVHVGGGDALGCGERRHVAGDHRVADLPREPR